MTRIITIPIKPVNRAEPICQASVRLSDRIPELKQKSPLYRSGLLEFYFVFLIHHGLEGVGAT